MKRYSSFIIVLLLAAVLFAPVNVPFNLESVAKVLPARQWVLFKAADGAMSASLTDHLSGQVKSVEGYQFLRGDLVNIHFSGETSHAIRKGQVIASISSVSLDGQLVNLRNQLAVEQASLGVVQSGQKSQLIKQLQEEINLSKEDLKLRQKTLDRAKLLYQDGTIALAELELAENTYAESAVKVKVAEKVLAVNETGEKKEAVTLATSKIESLKKEIAFLENKQSKYEITAPFDGLARFETLPEGTQLILEDTSATILLLPVRLRDSRYIRPGQNIDIFLLDNESVINATITEISDRVELFNLDRVVIAKAAVKKGKEFLPFGMPLRCRIHCGDVRTMEFLRRSVRWQ